MLWSSTSSVLGPILYLLYISPLGDVIRSHGLDFHFYTDDTQLYLAFESTNEEKLGALVQIETCVKEIDLWMVKNKLKLNGNKTELLVINARNRLGPAIEHIEVSNSRIMPSTSARNIGVTLDQHVYGKTYHQHRQNCFFHLRKIARIKVRYPNFSSCFYYIETR